MKKVVIFMALAFLNTAYANTITAQECKAAMKDVFFMMSYAVPCENDIQNPEILENFQSEKLHKKLEQCEKSFNQTQYRAFYQEVAKEAETEFTAFAHAIEKDKASYCQGQKKTVLAILKKYQ